MTRILFICLLALAFLSANVALANKNSEGSNGVDLSAIMQKFVDDKINSRLKLNISSSNRKEKAAVDVVILMDQTPHLVDVHYPWQYSFAKFNLFAIYRDVLEQKGMVFSYSPYARDGEYEQYIKKGEYKAYTAKDIYDNTFERFIMVRYAFIPRSKASAKDLRDLVAHQGCMKRKYTSCRAVKEFLNAAQIPQKDKKERQEEFDRIARENPYPNWVINILQNHLLFSGNVWKVAKPDDEDEPYYDTPFWDISNLRIIMVYSEEFLYSKFPTDSIDYYKAQLFEESYSRIASEQHIVTIPVLSTSQRTVYNESEFKWEDKRYTIFGYFNPVEYCKVYSPFHKESRLFTAFTEREVQHLKHTKPSSIFIFFYENSWEFLKDYSFNLKPIIIVALSNAIAENYFLLSMEVPIAHSDLYKYAKTPESRLNFTALPFEEENLYASDNMLSYHRKTPPNIYTFGGFDPISTIYNNDKNRLVSYMTLKYLHNSELNAELGTSSGGYPEIYDVITKKIQYTSYLSAPDSSAFDCMGIVYANKFLSHAYSIANNYIENNAGKMPLRELIKPFYVEPVFIISMVQASKCNVYMDHMFNIERFFSNYLIRTCPYIFVIMKALYDGMDEKTGLPMMKIKLEYIDSACDYSNSRKFYVPFKSCVKPDPYMHPFGIRRTLENMRVINIYDLLKSEDNTRNIDYSLRILDQTEEPDDFYVYSCEVSKCKNYFLEISEYQDDADPKPVFDKDHYDNTVCPLEGHVIPFNYADRLVRPFKPATDDEMTAIAYYYDGSQLTNFRTSMHSHIIQSYILPDRHIDTNLYKTARNLLLRDIYSTFSRLSITFDVPRELLATYEKYYTLTD